MLLSQIIVLTIVLLIFRIFFWPKSKNWLLFIISLIAVYWFQTPSAIRHLGFWLPTILLTISIIGWRVIFPTENLFFRENYVALIFILFFPLVLYFFKFIGITGAHFISDSPQLIVLLILPGCIFLYFLITNKISISKNLLSGFLLITMLVLLIILKNQTLTTYLSLVLRQMSGQSTALASSFDISWVGYSYFAFRLIHVLLDRDRLNKAKISLRDFVTYLVFFPAFTAGPIDRIERFHGELNNPKSNLLNDDCIEGGMRIFRGLFLKFILADSLAIISLNSYSANTITQSGALWINLYAYAFRIFFDFSGYTDIAIGIARIAGINLPENFKRPYLSRNITLFWNNWHITLTQWFRTYFFNPMTRFFRSNYKNLPPPLLIFFTQISTMILIGLWHGISWNFVIWGFWNGLGLFIHNRWSEKIKPKLTFLKSKPLSLPYTIISVIFTFNFIALGWVWFALPNLNDSLIVFTNLF
jgi:D-alanyl-lipoteichoic acid acyltransferase DltB (MBOAT superfamily)